MLYLMFFLSLAPLFILSFLIVWVDEKLRKKKLDAIGTKINEKVPGQGCILNTEITTTMNDNLSYSYCDATEEKETGELCFPSQTFPISESTQLIQLPDNEICKENRMREDDDRMLVSSHCFQGSTNLDSLLLNSNMDSSLYETKSEERPHGQSLESNNQNESVSKENCYSQDVKFQEYNNNTQESNNNNAEIENQADKGGFDNHIIDSNSSLNKDIQSVDSNEIHKEKQQSQSLPYSKSRNWIQLSDGMFYKVIIRPEEDKYHRLIVRSIEGNRREFSYDSYENINLGNLWVDSSMDNTLEQKRKSNYSYGQSIGIYHTNDYCSLNTMYYDYQKTTRTYNKTETVSGYLRKDGRYVHSYKRRRHR